MNAKDQFYGLKGTIQSREDLRTLATLCVGQEFYPEAQRISYLLNENPEAQRIEIEDIRDPGLSGIDHDGLAKEALDGCGRLRPGYKFLKGGKIVLVAKPLYKKGDKAYYSKRDQIVIITGHSKPSRLSALKDELFVYNFEYDNGKKATSMPSRVLSKPTKEQLKTAFAKAKKESTPKETLKNPEKPKSPEAPKTTVKSEAKYDFIYKKRSDNKYIVKSHHNWSETKSVKWLDLDIDTQVETYLVSTYGLKKLQQKFPSSYKEVLEKIYIDQLKKIGVSKNYLSDNKEKPLKQHTSSKKVDPIKKEIPYSKYTKDRLSKVVSNKSQKVNIYRFKKKGTKRVFFAPETVDGKRLNTTMYARLSSAIKTAQQFLKKDQKEVSLKGSWHAKGNPLRHTTDEKQKLKPGHRYKKGGTIVKSKRKPKKKAIQPQKVDDNGQYALLGAARNNTAPSLQGLRKMDATTEKSPLWEIPGTTGQFLQNIERKLKESVAVVFSTPPGTGKTTTVYKWMNDIAQASPTLFLSLEEHPDSNLATDKRDKYLSKHAQSNMNTAGSVPDKETLKKWISAHDVIVIDSWQKLVELIGPTKFDQEIRKAYDGKLFIIIFQETTTGRAKGGSDKVFDGDIIIKGHKGSTFSENYLYPEKHRYTTVPLDTLRYMIDDHKVVNPTTSEDTPEPTIENAKIDTWLTAH